MKKLKLVVFDVDGTLIRPYSSWQQLHKHLGTWNRSKGYAERFHQRNITYEEWAQLDASLWKNQPLQRVQQIINSIPYVDGTREVITTLRTAGFKVVLLSAGLSLTTERINREIGIDDSFANDLIVKNGLLTGEVKINVSFNNKDKALRPILHRFNVKINECAAVGDDTTMIPLFEKAGFRIAFNPRNRLVEKHADVVVRSEDLREILSHLFKRKE